MNLFDIAYEVLKLFAIIVVIAFLATGIVISVADRLKDGDDNRID